MGLESNQKTIKVYNRKGALIGQQTIDKRLNKRDINRLLNKRYPWTWEYYE